jgi:endoglucanase
MKALTSCVVFLLVALLDGNAETTLIRNDGFEDADIKVAWTNFSTAVIGVTTNAFVGQFAGVASNRTATTGGIAQDLRGVLTSGVTYWVSAWIRLDGPAGVTNSVTMAMKEDFAGSGVKYTTIKSGSVPDTEWIRFAGIFRYRPTGAEEILQLYVNGPATNYAIHLDDVQLLPPMIYTPPTNSVSTDFVRAQGRSLVVGNPPRPLRLRGVNLTACEDDDAEAVETQMGQARWDYEQIAATGMNVVRLNMWQKVRDDYTQPFAGYNPEGWEWLERQIVWAKTNNLYLLLDMHTPAGGYQGPNYSPQTKFWGSSATATNNRARLKNFWVSLATRYAHEPTIAGYDFLNEPCPQNQSQWESYALELVDAVRAVDANHLCNIEVAINTGTPFVLPRANLMYDLHHYDPWRFSNQFQPTSGYGDQGIWGVTNLPAIGWDFTAGSITNTISAPAGDFSWTKFTSALHLVTATNAVALEPVLINPSSGGTVYFDDFVINEYDGAGNFVRECMIADPEIAPANAYLVAPGIRFPRTTPLGASPVAHSAPPRPTSIPAARRLPSPASAPSRTRV